MQLLVRYGEALGAEKLVETNNVCTTVGSATPFMRDYAARGFDAVYSEFNLDSREVVETPPASAHTCQLIHGIDTRNWKHQGIPEDLVETQKKSEAFFGERGVKQLATCTPYQVGNVPVNAASIAPGWNPRPSSIAMPCSAPAPIPKAAKARARPASPTGFPIGACIGPSGASPPIMCACCARSTT